MHEYDTVISSLLCRYMQVGVVVLLSRANPGLIMLFRWRFNLRACSRAILLVPGVLTALGKSAEAKDAPLVAIELFDTSKGAAYVQIAGVLINGKAELRTCTSGSQKLDRSDYGRLPKVLISGAESLERIADGSMLLTRGGSSSCVVPANLKLEKDESLTPAQLADRGMLQGTVVSASTADNAIAPFKPGVRLQFVAAPDPELAEYLRAQRTNSVQGWQEYLGKYPASGHAILAKQATALLLVKAGEESLTAYRKSADAPSFPDLSNAKAEADRALALAPADAAALRLKRSVGIEVRVLTDKALSEFQAYRKSFSTHGPGYAHLGTSRELLLHILEVDSESGLAQSLQKQVLEDTRAVESSVHTAETLQKSQRFDDALTAVAAYRSYSDEEPRIAAIVQAAYKNHFEQGTAFLNGQKWPDAVREFQKAGEIRKTPEATAALAKAQDGLQAYQTKAAADLALGQSEAYASEHNFIDAYEVLAALPKASRPLAADRMQTLEPDYIKQASEKAKTLQSAHTPISGKADEVGILRAYDLLQSAYGLSESDNNLKLRLDLITESLSDYYLQQAKRYLDRPLGSGVGLAWMYLDQSQLFKPNRDDVRDERTKAASIYQMRSKLSLRVKFRDQTSRRDSAGFADQMSDAIATGVETSGLPVKVVRASDTSSVEPNFQLVGDVLQHRPILTPTIEPMESKYRFGAREVPNEEWNRVNRDYESATLELQSSQRVLEGAQTHGKKKEIADANAAVASAQGKVQEAHRRLDSLPKTNQEDVIKPYTYTKRTIDLTAVVEVSFRMLDANGDAIDPATPISKSNHKTFVVLENVKPDDTQGVAAQGTLPDEIQFLNDVEIDARDNLIHSVLEKVQGLPEKILALARKRVQEGDLDAAAEKYILYLNSTPEGETSERAEARQFLQKEFNIRLFTAAAPGR